MVELRELEFEPGRPGERLRFAEHRKTIADAVVEAHRRGDRDHRARSIGLACRRRQRHAAGSTASPGRPSLEEQAASLHEQGEARLGVGRQGDASLDQSASAAG